MKIKFFEYSSILLPIYLYGIYEIINNRYFLGSFIISISLLVSWILTTQNLKK